MSQSKIFAKNRALGYVSNEVPLITRYIRRRKECLIVTCIGRSFHTYGCAHFALLSVSGDHPGDITCLAGDSFHVYTASEGKIFAWRRGNEIKHVYDGHEHPVHLLLPFGPDLISIDEESNLKVWDIKTTELLWEKTFAKVAFKITAIVHPSTYINKVLLGSQQGLLQLWNLHTKQLIHTFQRFESAITVLQVAPAKDVVAIGFANGEIKLHNLKVDKTIFTLMQDWGAVTSISFRSPEPPIMATGSKQGHIVLWNLEERRVDSQIISAHFNAVAGLQFLPNEPLMVSNSSDNSLKLWIFDLADGAGRLLRIREGHAEPPTFTRFYGYDGHNILTSGSDSSLRIFSTVTETFNRSLGRASYNRKSSRKKGRLVDDNLIMPPIRMLAAEKTREKEWDNIAAVHDGKGVVTTWSYDKGKMGEHKLLPERFRKNFNANATCLALTHCGNFVVVGYNTGHVDRFNIQSGIHRDCYGGEGGAHEGPVTGIMVDGLNQEVVTAGNDGQVKFWSFQSRKTGPEPRTTITLREPIEWLRTHRESSLIALALGDFTIVLIDFETRRVVRAFKGHTRNLKDATFSPDSRWLITTSMDCTIRTWDIPSAKLVDVFQVSEPCISLDFSSTGDYLVTAHSMSLGIYLWSNKTLFSHVSLREISLDSPIPIVSLPGSVTESSAAMETLDIDPPTCDEEYISPEQLNADLITMSSLPTSKWANLLNIDIVKKRNKPKEPPKAPQAAPFFLPTLPSLDVQFDLSETPAEDDNSKLLMPANFSNLTAFGKLLKDSIDTGDFLEVITRLKKLGPSTVDFEIQSFSLDATWEEAILLQFMKMIGFMMESRRDFELSQAYLADFLKVHGAKISEVRELWKYLGELLAVQENIWGTLREKLYYNLSVIQHVKRM